ncbi:MAG TPA: monovalent cation/H(+) antiporter subunit G [Solirubrobacteraceae bacterium]|nr:monovalent cation/H(+) antiporter subunit G [Solirubrobacteraceae bacterium]
MTARQIAVDVFLWAGVVLTLISCLGVLVMRDAYARLHFTSPAILGAICIAVAVVVEDSFSLIGDKAILIALFLVVVSPVLTHATARAIRIATRGDWPVTPEERVEVEQP